MKSFAVISALVASALATTTPAKDYFCTVTVTKFADKAKCDAGKAADGTADAATATAFTTAAQAANGKQVESGDYLYKVTACTQADGVTVEYAKKDAKDTALAGDDAKAAAKAVTAVHAVTFDTCTETGEKWTFVSEADAKYNDFQSSNLCRVDGIAIFSDDKCKTKLDDAAVAKTALATAKDHYNNKVMYKHTQEACKDDKVASCADGKITVTQYKPEAAEVKDGDGKVTTKAVAKCTEALTDPAPVVYEIGKCRTPGSQMKTAASTVKSYILNHDATKDNASFLKAGAAALLAFAATQF